MNSIRSDWLTVVRGAPRRERRRTSALAALVVALPALAACSGENTTDEPPYAHGNNTAIQRTPPPVEYPQPPHVLTIDFSCSPDAGLPACDVSFSKDIFPKMTSTGSWQCAAAPACHGGSTAPLMNDHSATDTYNALYRYQLGSSGTGQQYVVPCAHDPDRSAIACNLAVPSTCGSAMPLKVKPAITAVSPEDLQTIRAWLACGAPDN